MARTTEEQREAAKQRARARAAAGLCCSCNRKAVNGTRRCELHRAVVSEHAKTRYKARRAAAVCPQCRNPANAVVEGKTCCRPCLDYHAVKTAAARALPGHKEAHKAYIQEHYAEWKSLGLCVLCGKEPALPDKVQGTNCQEAQRRRAKRLAVRRRLAVITHYGGKCACCGEATFEFLEIDHVNNDGAAHRREIGNGKLYRWLIANDYPAGFQVLCSNCNCAKGRYGICPHQTGKVAARPDSDAELVYVGGLQWALDMLLRWATPAKVRRMADITPEQADKIFEIHRGYLDRLYAAASNIGYATPPNKGP